MTPTFCSAARSGSGPESDDWLPPSESTVSFLRWTAGRSKESGVALSMVAVAFRCEASTLASTTVCYALSTTCATAATPFFMPE